MLDDTQLKTTAAWLSDQPGAWHEMNRALQDVSILLQFLGELPDARLLGYFTDTQSKIAEAGARRSAPPCDNYNDFLVRLSDIAAAFQTGRAELLPEVFRDGTATGHSSAVAFVFWSRDFLAAVAAPATAESIRLTHDFLVCRAWSFWQRKRPAQALEPNIPALPPDLGAPTRTMLARKLAWRVRFYELCTIAGVFVTVLVSVYALTGGLILSNEQAMQDAWAKLDAQLEAEETKLFAPLTGPIKDTADLRPVVVGLCDLTRTDPPGTSDGQPAVNRVKYVMPHQAHLCEDRPKALLNLFVATMHLQSWSSVITSTLGTASAYPFGVVASTLHGFAQEDPACFGLRPADLTKGSAACERVLWDEIDRSRHVAVAILGAVNQYLLPVLYSFLGAMAAALRLLRRKVEASLLSYTDRPRLQQGAILGVLCGAVIGLFASFLGNMSGTGTVATAAVALLAGYNVDGVFRFFDELSDRLFRPATPAKPG